MVFNELIDILTIIVIAVNLYELMIFYKFTNFDKLVNFDIVIVNIENINNTLSFTLILMYLYKIYRIIKINNNDFYGALKIINFTSNI